MENNGKADFPEDGKVLAAMCYNGEAYQHMLKSTLEEVEYMQQLNI